MSFLARKSIQWQFNSRVTKHGGLITQRFHWNRLLPMWFKWLARCSPGVLNQWNQRLQWLVGMKTCVLLTLLWLVTLWDATARINLISVLAATLRNIGVQVYKYVHDNIMGYHTIKQYNECHVGFSCPHWNQIMCFSLLVLASRQTKKKGCLFILKHSVTDVQLCICSHC